jgi:hypothetical protein
MSFLPPFLSLLNFKFTAKAIFFNKCIIKSNHNTLRTHDMQPATRTTSYGRGKGEGVESHKSDTTYTVNIL